MRKLSVSVPADVLVEAERLVEAGLAPSMSAFVTDALRAKVKNRGSGGLRALLDEWDQEFGPPSEAAMEWARRVLGPR